MRLNSVRNRVKGIAEQPLCLRFVNTLNWRLSAHPEEGLKDYAGLISWSRRAKVWNGRAARRLIGKSASARRKADSVYAQSIRLRETIYRIFAEAGRSHRPRSDDVKILSRYLTLALSRLQIVPKARGFQWKWIDFGDALDGILWPVVKSAADLLTSSEFSQVRVCPGKGCGWLFVDKSRNGMRKWCDMKDCGNRAKASRHYRKIRKVRA